jgi:NSS family neurotransmitter:Na+ symporter
MERQSWGSRLGIILAVAGSAVGLGNFLRFPAQAVQNGGGAFLIPYFIALILVGLPLVWVEWTMGRFGGQHGHGTAPGVFHVMSHQKKAFKYFGVLGIFGPMIIFFYYLYIESWLLGYMWNSLTPLYHQALDSGQMKEYFLGYVGLAQNQYFSGISTAYVFFVITFVLNFWILSGGISKGIEKLSLWGMPILLILAIILTIRVLTLGTPDPSHPELNISSGLGFLWNPDFSQLLNAKVWLAATGQILFTLSVGMGCIVTYASYLRKKDDVVLSGLTAASTNEFVEVILGGSLVIPVAFIFLGQSQLIEVAKSGTFNLGLVTMPYLLGQLPFATVLALVWFLLLFIAGITSSVSMVQPGLAFLEDELKWSRKKTLIAVAVFSFIACQPAVLFFSHGVVDEMDFWAGTVGLVVLSLIEVILFAWIFGINKGWDEMHAGADIHVPKIFKSIIKYITPLFLATILVVWLIQDGIGVLMMKNIKPEDSPYVIATRIAMICFFIMIAWMTKKAFDKKYKQKNQLTGENK